MSLASEASLFAVAFPKYGTRFEMTPFSFGVKIHFYFHYVITWRGTSNAAIVKYDLPVKHP